MAGTITNGATIELIIEAPAPLEFIIEDAPPLEFEITGGAGPRGPQGESIKGDKGDTGPAGPIAGADKQVQFNDAGKGGVDTNFKWDKNTKTLRIGIEDDAPLPNNPLAMVGAIDGYLQTNIRNTTEGALASSDYVATADNGTDESYYIDMGINSSVYDSPDYEAFKANDSYVIAEGGDLDLCSTKDRIRLIVGGTMDEDVVGEVVPSGIALKAGSTVSVGGYPLASTTNRPEIFSGTGSPPDPAGLADGSLFFKYSV